MAPVFQSAELEDGLVCVRYLTPGGRGRFKVVPEIFRLREAGRGFDLEVMETEWDRMKQKHVVKKPQTVLLRVSRADAEALAGMGVPIHRKRAKSSPSGWKSGTVRVIDPSDRRRSHDVLAEIFQDYAVALDDFGAIRVYQVSTGEGVAAKTPKGEPRPWYSMAEAKRSIQAHYKVNHAEAA
jgi:hypothetical protein